MTPKIIYTTLVLFFMAAGFTPAIAGTKNQNAATEFGPGRKGKNCKQKYRADKKEKKKKLKAFKKAQTYGLRL